MINPNNRVVTIRLPRRLVCRLLALLQASAHHETVALHRQTWNEIYAMVRQDLAEHDVKWGGYNAV